MGREIALCVSHEDGLRLVGGTEQKGHAAVGSDLFELLGLGKGGPPVNDNLNNVIGHADVVIDFTSPDSTLEHFNIAADHGASFVTGTTGFSEEQLFIIKNSRSGEIGYVMAPNMSVGVNVMFKLAAEAVKTLGAGYDIEITEIHHRHKKDAPSGTALRLAEICAQGCGRDIERVGVYGRHGFVGERKPEEIAVMSLRAGDAVGEHTVIFGGAGERLEITHRAGSRKNFAMGAIRAAKWIVKQKPGMYDMQDVLSIK